MNRTDFVKPVFHGTPFKMQYVDSGLDASPLKITLGIEFEFLLAVSTYPKEATASTLRQSKGLSLVKTALSQPMKAQCASCGEWHEFNLRFNIKSHKDPTSWTVEGDPSVRLFTDKEERLGDNFKYFHFYPVEVKSRVLYHHGALKTRVEEPLIGCAHKIRWFQEVEAVLKRIHDRFIVPGPRPLGTSRAFAMINRSCGLHVHVGNEKRGFPLRTVQKVLSTYVANERIIDALHTDDRISGSKLALEPLEHPLSYIDDYDMHPRIYNLPWSKHLIQIAYGLGKKQRDLHSFSSKALATPVCCEYVSPGPHLEVSVSTAAFSFNVVDWLEVIDRAPSLTTLQNLQHGWAHNSTLNLANLGQYDSHEYNPNGRTMTFEFRQHAGTLDQDSVRAWVDVVVGIVQHAHDISAADFKELCTNVWQSPTYGTVDLLKTIKCSDRTIEHYGLRLGMPRASSNHGGDDVFRKDMANLELLPHENLIRPLVELLNHKQAQSLLPSNVYARIDEKLRLGGYGQFSREYLDELTSMDIGPELREKLTIGWTNEPPSCNPYGDD